MNMKTPTKPSKKSLRVGIVLTDLGKVAYDRCYEVHVSERDAISKKLPSETVVEATLTWK